jgi:hypothetical protein
MSLTVVKNKVNRPNACFTTLCQSTDFGDQSNLYDEIFFCIGCSFKFSVKVGIEESIVKAPRITDHGSVG